MAIGQEEQELKLTVTLDDRAAGLHRGRLAASFSAY
jgi:hypothetical protein